MIKKSFAVLPLICALNLVLAAQISAGPQALQPKSGVAGAAATAKSPTKDEVDAALRRTLGYDPAVTWVIYDIRPSVIPGVTDVYVGLNKQDPLHIYWDANGQNAVIGQILPFGTDPFAPIRTTLQAADGPALGPQSPAIVIVEFSDLECPHCKVAQPIAEKLAADFPQVRYVFQQFPLPASMHPWALKAAEYADCVSRLNPPVFWKYIDSIFDNQGGIAAATAEDKLKELAGAAGLDPAKISTCAALPQTEARVKKSLQLGESLDVSQTPTLFINGRRVLGLADIPYDQLKNLVQFEINHAGK
ncbi:MAG TPA: thioredoxin domain-containing protein [Candidatus Angelobacter sp.]